MDGMLWRVGHALVSKRQVFGWQAERNTAVIGAGGIEIESKMRVDRVRIAKLPLQGACRGQAPRAARGKQQRYRLGAKVDRKSPVAPQSGLDGGVRNVAAPGVGHRLDASRGHDETGRIDLRGSFRNLDLRALEVADLGAVVGRCAMPRDAGIVVQTGLGISQCYAGKHKGKQREYRERIKCVRIDDAAGRGSAVQI